MSQGEPERHFRTCHLCEALCGLEIEHQAGQILAIRGDAADPFSQGHICPKASAIADFHQDPNRLRRPVRRTLKGWQELSWDEAFSEVVDHLVAVREAHGADALATYTGNPAVHNYAIQTHSAMFLKPLKTRNRFSATSVDQLPHQLVAYLMFGHQMLLPIPDLDHTDLFMVLGANPVVSNGSLMSAPGMRKRLLQLRERGGRLIVIDPRRTETARLADEHHFIKPGCDALVLAAMLRCLLEEDLLKPGRLMASAVDLGETLVALEPFSTSVVAGVSGLSEASIRGLARELASAKSAVVYGRMGCSTQPFGSLCQWLINLLNLATGNLDRRGGAMFTRPAFDLTGPESRAGHYDLWRSRVRGLPEFAGELPVAAMAEEMLTPGPGQVKALITIAGNPVLSTPQGARLEQALAGLDYMVAIDPYINETSRFAKIILPPGSPLERDHYDLTFNALAVRNVAKYAEAMLPQEEGTLQEWEIFAGLSAALARRIGGDAPKLPTPQAILNRGLSAGPYGAARGHQQALDLERLRGLPHGIDLGPLTPLLMERLAGLGQRIQCGPKPLLEDLIRLEDFMHLPQPSLCLIGRRLLRSNNSWMHNLPPLAKGKTQCTLLMHPLDAHLRELVDGQEVQLQSEYGSVSVKLEVSEDVMPGVVCLPHGFGHQRPGVQLDVAASVVGASYNEVSGCDRLDLVSGNAAFNGTPVEVEG